MSRKIPSVLDLYNEWRSQCLFRKTGAWPRKVLSLDNVKDQDKLVHFEKFIKTLENTDGIIDWKLYIESLASFYEGWFGPDLLNSQKSIHIYKTAINIKNIEENTEDIYLGILRSLKFVVAYCNENDLHDFDSYLFDDSTLFPTILKHLSAGSITFYFLALIPNIDVTLKAFPNDVRDSCAADFLAKYKNLKNSVFSVKKIREVRDFVGLINKLITKGEQMQKT